MGSCCKGLINSSILRKQCVALVGLALSGFVFGHLAGNLLMFVGHDAFNAYADKLQSLGGMLWVARLGLLACLTLHIVLTVLLYFENLRARPQGYGVYSSKGDRSFATRTMIFTGILLLAFVLFHLWDFTIGPERTAEHTFVSAGHGECEHLFGYIWRSFTDPWRALAYILGVCCVGVHLTHAIESAFQTFGASHLTYTPLVKKLSLAAGIFAALLFSAIPIYVMIMHHIKGVTITI